ncbi:MAG: hypothetical protein ACMZ64_01355 [Oleiphilus sp.]
MKQRSSNNDKGFPLRQLIVLLIAVGLSACSSTYLKTLDDAEPVQPEKLAVAIETDCNDIDFGGQKLAQASDHIEQVVSEYGFNIVHGNEADFLLHFMCSKESHLNGGFLPNGISAMLMVASLSLLPTYWPSNLWVEMEVYDLRTPKLARIDTQKASFVSQERMVWAPFFLFKIGYEFGLEKYDYDEFYKGISSSSLSLLNKAQNNSIFE